MYLRVCQACLYNISLWSYLGTLSVCLACRYKISLVVPFPLDQEHQLARGVSCADNTLRLQRIKNVFQISITELEQNVILRKNYSLLKKYYCYHVFSSIT